MNKEQAHSAPDQMRAVISGGGTGGHLFPALAIAKQMEAEYPDIDILFIGAKGRMEMEKVPQKGYKIQGLWISGFTRGAIFKNLLLPFKILSSLIKSHKILKSFKPNIAIGTGGFASAPLLYTAAKMKIPTLIQEQNFFPGITNRFLGNKVDKICVVYESLEKYFDKSKMVITGNPVRIDLNDERHSKEEAKENFGLERGKPTFLVVGGSLGARSINDAMKVTGPQLSEQNIQGIWQTGKLYKEEIREFFKDNEQKHLAIQAFIDDMPQAYKAADLVICRAGAITLAELAYLGKAAILVPSPNVAEDHQTKNAQTMVEKDAALMIPDKHLKEELFSKITNTIKDESKIKMLEQNIKTFSRPNATKDIVNEVVKLINSN